MENQIIWKAIKGYEGLYEVNNLGQVRSLPRPGAIPGQLTGGGYISGGNDNGYIKVGLHKDKIRKYLLVHRLVAEAFLPNPEKKAFVNHIDNNGHNNRLENLEWVTPEENNHHYYYSFLGKTRKPKPKSKLTEHKVRQIRELYLKGMDVQVIADNFDTCKTNILQIVNYTTWFTVDPENKIEYLTKAKEVQRSKRIRSHSLSLNSSSRKLSVEAVNEIRRLWTEEQPVTRTVIANKYGVGVDTISDIIERRTHRFI